jgi:hypothetical protein
LTEARCGQQAAHLPRTINQRCKESRKADAMCRAKGF